MQRAWCWPAPESLAGRALNWGFQRVRRSRSSARCRFGLAYAERSPAGRAYYDTTTVALQRVLEPKVRANPDLKLLEIGAGPYAVLCGRLSRLTRRRVDALEVQPARVASAIRHVQRNGFNVRVFESDLLDRAESSDYDLIFWNLPYYSGPTGYLPRLFEQVASRLSPEGELVLGTYNAALPGEVILRFLSSDSGLVLRSHHKTWWGQEVLTFTLVDRATDAERRPPSGESRTNRQGSVS